MHKTLAFAFTILASLAAHAEEVLIYSTYDPATVRAVDPDGSNDRLLFEGKLRDFSFGSHGLRKKTGLVATEAKAEEITRPAGQGTEWAVQIVYPDGRKTVVVPFSSREVLNARVSPSEKWVAYQLYQPGYTASNVPIHMVRVDGTGRRQVGAGDGWVWAVEQGEPQRPDRDTPELGLERQPAEVFVKRSQPSQDPIVAEVPPNGAPPTGLGLPAVAAWAALPEADRGELQRDLQTLSRLLMRTGGRYSVTRYQSSGTQRGCVIASEDRARDFSSQLSSRWTIGTYTWPTQLHSFNVATFTASDGTTLHFQVDSYVPVLLFGIRLLGDTSRPPREWIKHFDYDYRQGRQTVTALDREIAHHDHSAAGHLLSQTRSYQRVPLDPPVCMAYGVTLLPFRVTVRTPGGEPHGTQVTVRTASPACSLSSSANLSVALSEQGRGTTQLDVQVGSDGRSQLLFLVVADPWHGGSRPQSVSVQVAADGATREESWEIQDNLQELLRRYRQQAQESLPPGSIDRLLTREGLPEHHQRQAFVDQVLLPSVGNATLDAPATRELVVATLDRMSRDTDTAHLFSGLNYLSWVDGQAGSVRYPVAVFSPWDPTQHAILDPLPQAGSSRDLAFLQGYADPAQHHPEAALASVRQGVTVLLSCPVELSFVTSDGQRVGYDGQGYVNELDASYSRRDLPEADGTTAKLVELGELRAGSLEVHGLQTGSFSLDVLYHQADGSAVHVAWTHVAIQQGEVVTFPLDVALDAQPTASVGLRADGQVLHPSLPPTTVHGESFEPQLGAGGRRGGGCSLGGTPGAPGLPALVFLALLLGLLARRPFASVRG